MWLMARSEQLRQLAAQLASLASLEDVVTHGLQSLLESPSRLVAPTSSVEQDSAASIALAVLPCLKLLLVVHCAPFCSVSVGPLVCPLRAAPRLFPTGRSPPTAALAPQPLPLAALSFGARPVRPMPPLRPSLAPRLLTLVRLPPGRQVRGVHQAPLRQDDASGTSTARERDATPNARCGVRFSVKTSLFLQCGPAAPIHHPMMLSTTPTTMRCLLFGHATVAPVLLASRRSTSSPSRSLAVSPWTFSPESNRTTLWLLE